MTSFSRICTIFSLFQATTDDDEDDEADGDEDVDVDKIVEEVGAQPLRLLTAASADG